MYRAHQNSKTASNTETYFHWNFSTTVSHTHTHALKLDTLNEQQQQYKADRANTLNLLPLYRSKTEGKENVANKSPRGSVPDQCDFTITERSFGARYFTPARKHKNTDLFHKGKNNCLPFANRPSGNHTLRHACTHTHTHTLSLSL